MNTEGNLNVAKQKARNIVHWRDEFKSKKEELCYRWTDGWMKDECQTDHLSSSTYLIASSLSLLRGQQGRPLKSETLILERALWRQTTWEMEKAQAEWWWPMNAGAHVNVSDALKESQFQKAIRRPKLQSSSAIN